MREQPTTQTPVSSQGALVRASLFMLGICFVIFLAAWVVSLVLGFFLSPRQVDSGSSAEGSVVRPHTPPLSSAGFNPEKIIADEEFFTRGTMSEEDIRQFINEVGRGCVPGADGTPCLKDYRLNISAHPADEFCSRPVLAQENADVAALIYSASQACAINPKVLLVTLQKEQGLLTAWGPRLIPRRYEAAMGYYCPDAQPCNPNFKGIDRQVYYAARQFARYPLQPERYSYRSGKSAKFQYNYDKSCGSVKLTPRNNATAALYNYTPFPPLPDTLEGNAGECETWGNLNFYMFYKAWFGLKK
ncbi:hypothetical protein KRX54_01225 [Actinomycetaceae bacterium TAE3-ERU4]|nr:hypothetical protein [Actinomycetaceae bacterium TAE3-ERU4]